MFMEVVIQCFAKRDLYLLEVYPPKDFPSANNKIRIFRCVQSHWFVTNFKAEWLWDENGYRCVYYSLMKHYGRSCDH